MAESHALLRPGERGFKRALRDAGGLRGDADAAAIESGERDFVAFAFIADAVGAGTSQSVKTSSQQAVALMPSFFSSLPTLKPGVPFSTTSAVIPFSPLGGSVFTYAIAASAEPPLVIHALVPLRTYVSPFFRALVCSAAALEPACGSVSA